MPRVVNREGNVAARTAGMVEACHEIPVWSECEDVKESPEKGGRGSIKESLRGLRAQPELQQAFV